MKKYLALIEPLENPAGKATVDCNVKFVTGDLAHRSKRYSLSTDIFSHYFWGFAFETVVLNDNGTVREIHDLNKEDRIDFNVELLYAVTYNNMTHEVLASNGFVYILDESPFAGYCRPMLNRIYQEISYAQIFCLIMYTLNGAVFSLLFDKNFPESSSSYKYALTPGYITVNKKTLGHLSPKASDNFDKNEKLSQQDIDKLIAGITGH